MKDNVIQGSATHKMFPTTMSDLGAIQTFASAHGKTFADSEALAVEVKTSWVETTGLTNPSDYITIQAEVPTYNTSNAALWTQTGTHTATLALVGMHVVGSVSGHPEMIWASFEHLGNTPNEAYDYVTGGGVQRTQPRDTSGDWLFTTSGSTGPFDVNHMFLSSTGIQAASGLTVSPSDTIRWKAFGAASDLSPDPLVSAALSNSEIISVNNSIFDLTLGQLKTGDIRKNYYMLGATWTIGGEAPTSGQPMPNSTGNQVGTSRLENTTLETYDQASAEPGSCKLVGSTDTKPECRSATGGGVNCMTCHQSGTTAPALADTFVSQVFPIIKPLF